MKHHYIPASYLRRWTNGTDNKLCSYHRPFKKVVAKRVAPEGTGYVEDLYALVGEEAEERRQLIENGFFRRVDQGGSDAIRMMIEKTSGDLPEKLLVAWSIYLLSLIQRQPQKVAFFNKHAETVYPEDAFEAEAGLSRFGAELMMTGSTGKNLIKYIMGMRWTVHNITEARHTLLTCDSPLVMTNGLVHAQGHIYLPLSPNHFFLAANNDETRDQINNGIIHGTTIRDANAFIVEEAYRYVYGCDASQLRFVENRMAPKGLPFPSKTPVKRPQMTPEDIANPA